MIFPSESIGIDQNILDRLGELIKAGGDAELRKFLKSCMKAVHGGDWEPIPDIEKARVISEAIKVLKK